MKLYTDKFEDQKRNHKIYDELDPLIETFILNLNKCDNIVTLHSCEGTDNPLQKWDPNSKDTHSITPYFGFNVNEETWTMVWLKVIPELMSEIDINIGTNGFQDGIFIHGGRVDKFKFWMTIFKTFNKYFIK